MADALIARLQRAGFRGESLRKAWAIVMRESGGNPKAYNGDSGTGDKSYGLAQINMIDRLGPARRKQYGLRSNEELLNPDTNLRVMYQMSGGGKDFGPWAVGPHAYKGAPASAKTRYEELYKQFPGAGSTPVAAQGRGTPQRRLSAAGGQDPRGVALALLQRGRQRRGEGSSRLLSMLADAPPPPQAPAAPTAPSRPMPQGGGGGGGGGGKGGIRELFYDPKGAYDEGNWISPIGGHSDHVHVSFGTPQAAMQAIRYAQSQGLRASENPYAEGSPAEKGVHTGTSYHYRSFPGQFKGGKSPVLGQGLDVSGDAAKLARYFEWVKSRWGL